MSVIDRAVKALPAHGLSFQATARTLTVPPATNDGFAVTLALLENEEYEVSADGWSERFERSEDAVDCFLLLLSEQGRLKVTLRGTTAVGWQLERREFGMWAPGRPVRRTLVPFWRRAQIVWKQNHVFKVES